MTLVSLLTLFVISKPDAAVHVIFLNLQQHNRNNNLV